MIDNQDSRQVALEHILKVLAKGSSRAIQYSTILVGFVALLPGINLPPEMTSLVAISLNSISSLIDRVANNNNISDDEIKTQVEIALQKNGIDKLIEKDDFYHAISLLQKNQHSNHKEHELLFQTLLKIIPPEIDLARVFPSISISRRMGITVSGTNPSTISEKIIANRVEHEITLSNDTEFEYRSLGFAIQYPEYVEHPPRIKSPPGCDINLEGENMEWEVVAKGSGSVQTPQVTHYGSFVIEAGRLMQGENIVMLLRSVPDPNFSARNSIRETIYYWVCGEVRIKKGNSLIKQGFTFPLFYDGENRNISAGQVHDSALHQDKYTVLRRS